MTWTINTNDFKVSQLTGEVLTCSQKEKIILSFKKISVFLVCALVSVFIPVLHFILVPAFLIAGAYAFGAQYKYTNHVKFGSFLCPKCKKENSFNNTYFYSTQKLNCVDCLEQLTIRLS